MNKLGTNNKIKDPYIKKFRILSKLIFLNLLIIKTHFPESIDYQNPYDWKTSNQHNQRPFFLFFPQEKKKRILLAITCGRKRNLETDVLIFMFLNWFSVDTHRSDQPNPDLTSGFQFSKMIKKQKWHLRPNFGSYDFD